MKYDLDDQAIIDKYFNFKENNAFQLYLFTVYTMTALGAWVTF
jgi:hypothetical protein